MTVQNAALGVAIGSPLFALYILGVLLAFDMDSAPGQYALVVPVSYFLGSMPWGFLLTQAADAGRPQSPDTATTSLNALSISMATLDAGKGALSVALGWAVIDTGEGAIAAGLAVLAGHSWSVFRRLRGERGAATLLGGLLVMEPIAGAIGAATLPLALLGHRLLLPMAIVVAGIAFMATLVMAFVDQTTYLYLLYVGPAALLVIYRHREGLPLPGRIL